MKRSALGSLREKNRGEIIELDENLKSSILEVTTILKNHGNFQTVRKNMGVADLKKLLLKLYPKYTIKEIEEIMGIPDSTLQRWFICLGIPTTKRWHVGISVNAGIKNKEKFVEENGKIRKSVTFKLTPELAYLVGFTLGDGTVQKYMVEVYNKDEGLKAHLYEILRPYGTISENRRENGLWRLRLSSVRLSGLIKHNKKIRVDTLDKIFSRRLLARKFIAAFWDAEGTVRKQDGYFHIYLYNSNKKLLNRIGKFLKSRKISYSELFIDSRKRIYSYHGRPIIAKKILHRLSIPKSCSITWAKEIGVHMLHSKKKKVVEEILKKGDLDG